MKWIVLTLVGCLIPVSFAAAQPAPEGPPPVFKIVSSTDSAKGLIVFRDLVYKVVPVMVEVVVIKNGIPVTEKRTEHKYVPEWVVRQIDAAKSRIITPDGKQLPIDAVWKRLQANPVVVVSSYTNAPAAAFLRALSAETLVIIPPVPIIWEPAREVKKGV